MKRKAGGQLEHQEKKMCVQVNEQQRGAQSTSAGKDAILSIFEFFF